MPIRQDVQDAFTTLGLNTDADLQQATKAYKRLALLHHPDRNQNDPHATQRFQEIGHAWDICQRYYENPAFGESRFRPDDDDDFLDEDDMFEFYMFMFAETLFNRYNRESGKRYRFEQSGRKRARGGPIFTFSPTFSSYSSSYADDSQERKDRHEARQKAHNDAYESRKRELELEIEREEREAREQVKKQKADEDRLVSAHERAFQAAYSGDSDLVQNLIKEFNLDITAPRNLKNAKNLRKQDDTQYETLLHAAATHCDEQLFMFLIETGKNLRANPNMLNKHQLTPFHAAIKAGNNNLVRFIIERRGKAFQGYHPSKATLAGHTPLQLAIESGDRTTVELLVKHATVHDVERCWKLVDTSEELKNVLRTKKGFVPPGEGLEPPSAATSKKAQKQQGLTQEKEARIAEELRRAEINRQKKEERGAKRALMEEEKKAREEDERITRQREEAEERQRVEELRRREEAVARARELEEARLRAEAQAQLKVEQEAKDRAAAAERAKLEKERQRVERERLQTESRERERLEKEKRERERHEKERNDRERVEKEKREREKAVKQKAVEDERERQVALERQDRLRQAEATRKMEEMVRAHPVTPATPAAAAPSSSKKREKMPPRPVLTEEQHKELRREKQRERRRTKAIERQLQRADQVASPATTIPAVISQPATPSMGPVSQLIHPPQASSSFKAKSNGEKKVVDPEKMDERQRKKLEQAMRRRAEQSARDKERHRRLMEERKAAKLEAKGRLSRNETPEYVPLTPVSTHTARTGIVPPPASVIFPFGDAQLFMEDIQTQVGVDDLFRVERPAPPPPPPKAVVEPPVVPKSGRPYRKYYRGQPSRT